jgi:predicted acetyltransferase
MTTSRNSLTVNAASEFDRLVLEQLWTMFRHDMSAFTGSLPDEHGRFRQERLDAALSDPAWAAFVFRSGRAAVGFAVVRGLDAERRVISSFFIANGARRQRLGRAAAEYVTSAYPGPWSVAFQDSNTAASQFWPAVAAIADKHWSLDHQPVPGRPDLPADAWIHFNVG